MNKFSEIKLNDELIIYKSEFDWKYPQDKIIEKVKQNLSYIGLDDLTTSSFLLQSNEINYVKEYCRNIAINILGKSSEDVSSWAEQSWIYFSDKRTHVNPGDSEMFHRHTVTLTRHRKNLPHIKTDISYCFYVNVPTDLIGDEGKIIFKDKNYKDYSLTPNTGDILFFNPNYLHKPNLIHNSTQERIVICTNLTINFKDLIDKDVLI
jgi:hypothetical protein